MDIQEFLTTFLINIRIEVCLPGGSIVYIYLFSRTFFFVPALIKSSELT